MDVGEESTGKFVALLNTNKAANCLHHFTTNKINALNIIINFAAMVITISCLLPLGCIMLLTIAYSKSVDTVLSLKLGELYGGRLGLDHVFTRISPPCYVTMMFIFNYEGEEDDVHARMRKLLFKLHKSHYKFSSAIRKYFGSSYYLKNQFNFEDVMEEISYLDVNELSRRSSFFNIFKDAHERAIPDNKVLWKAQIVSVRSSEKCYKICPIIIRYHHAIADGVSFLSLWSKVFGEQVSQQEVNCESRHGPYFSLKELSNIFCDVRNLAHKHIHTNLLTSPNRRYLHGENNRRRNQLVMHFEENRKYYGLVKEIKSRFEDITFMEIIFTVFSSSCHDYYSQIRKSPKIVTLACVTRPRCEDTNNLTKGLYTLDQVGNNFTISYLRPPFCDSPQISNNLFAVHRNWKSKHTFDDQLIFWGRKMSFHFPNVLPDYFTRMFFGVDMIFSNLPGIELGEVSVGMKLQDFFFCTSQTANEGIRLFINTQDERFHVVLACDEDVGLTDDDFQNILDRMFHNIDKLNDETKKLTTVITT